MYSIKRKYFFLSIILFTIIVIVILIFIFFHTNLNTYDTEKAKSVDQTVDDTNDNKLSPSETLVNNDFDKMTFVKVVGSDTILVNDGEKDIKVRFLSVDTYESISSNTEENNTYAEMSYEFTKDYFNDIDKVYLQYDTEKEDSSGRTLAYVWLSDEVDPFNESDILSYMFNAILLDKGMAYVSIYKPNNYYEGLFRKIESESFISKIGLWKYDEFRDMLVR